MLAILSSGAILCTSARGLAPNKELDMSNNQAQRTKEIIDFCYSEDCWVYYAAERLGFSVSDAEAALKEIEAA